MAVSADDEVDGLVEPAEDIDDGPRDPGALVAVTGETALVEVLPLTARTSRNAIPATRGWTCSSRRDRMQATWTPSNSEIAYGGKSVLPVRSARVLRARWRNLAPVHGRGPLRALHRVTAAVLTPLCSAVGLTALQPRNAPRTSSVCAPSAGRGP